MCIVEKHMLGQAHRFFSPWSLRLPRSSFIHVPYVVSQCAPEGIDIHTRLRSAHAHVRLAACVTVCILNSEVVSSSPPGGGGENLTCRKAPPAHTAPVNKNVCADGTWLTAPFCDCCTVLQRESSIWGALPKYFYPTLHPLYTHLCICGTKIKIWTANFVFGEPIPSPHQFRETQDQPNHHFN